MTYRNKNQLIASMIVFMAAALLAAAPLVSQAAPLIQSVRPLIPLENLLAGMVFMADGSLAVLDHDGGRLVRLRLRGDLSIESMETLADGFVDPIAVERSGLFEWLVAERNGGRIFRVRNGAVTLAADGFGDISSIRLTSEGLLVCELGPGKVTLADLDDGDRELLLSGLEFPSDILPVRGGLIVSELVNRPGAFGRLSFYGDGDDEDDDDGDGDQSPGPGPGGGGPAGPGGPPDWDADDDWSLRWRGGGTLIDPLRMLAPLRFPGSFLVSVRYLEPRAPAAAFQPGGILVYNRRMGQMTEPFADGLFGPASMDAGSNGVFVMEEHAERITHIDWNRNRSAVWDGLGQPRRMVRGVEDGSWLVVESVPRNAVVRVANEGLRNCHILPEAYANGRVGGAAVHRGRLILTITSLGEIIAIGPGGGAETVTQSVFAPAAIQIGSQGMAYVLDPLFRELAVFPLDRPDNIRRIQLPPGVYTDLALDERSGDGGGAVYVLETNTGGILRFGLNSAAGMERLPLPDLPRQNGGGAVFSRVPGRGFLIALNDGEGTLAWAGDDGETAVIGTEFREAAQVVFEAPDRATVLSSRGWLREAALRFENDTVRPTPTPEQPHTAAADWRLHE